MGSIKYKIISSLPILDISLAILNFFSILATSVVFCYVDPQSLNEGKSAEASKRHRTSSLYGGGRKDSVSVFLAFGYFLYVSMCRKFLIVNF